MNLFIKALLFLFIGTMANAQSFQGVITDLETGKPISQITIVSADQTYFVTSNEKGEVVLSENIINKKLFINDYEYQYSEKTFATAQPFVWELTPNSETLEEIVIYEDAVKTLDEIIANSIKSFSNNIKLEAYYRENYIENNQVASFAVGIVDFYVNDKIDMVAKQTHAKDITSVDETNRAMATTPTQLVDYSMRFSALRKMLQDKKKYEFYVTAKTVGDKTIHTCYINPLEKSKKRFLMKGYFVFDEAKKLILEASYGFDPEKKQYNSTMNMIIGKFDFNDLSFKSKYMATDLLYYPSYSKFSKDLTVNSKLAKMKNVKVNNDSYFYVLNATKTNEKPAVERIFKMGTLYSSGDKYSREFWNDPEIINLEE